MIYARLFGLTLVASGAFAAPTHHTKSGPYSELIAAGPDSAQPVSLISKDKYPSNCVAVWEKFNDASCWCSTGCALDCHNGGTPGVPGTTSHPGWCEKKDKIDDAFCQEVTCAMIEDCKDSEGAHPGLSYLLDTAGYTCTTPVEHDGYTTEAWSPNSFIMVAPCPDGVIKATVTRPEELPEEIVKDLGPGHHMNIGQPTGTWDISLQCDSRDVEVVSCHSQTGRCDGSRGNDELFTIVESNGFAFYHPWDLVAITFHA